jgi:cytochrome oxidase Cu insertion factor (SCO1/SenC/PrrC family)
MRRLGIRTAVAARDTLSDGTETVMISHSDKMILLDARGRIVETYGGGSAPPQMVADDARALLRAP